MGRLIRLMVVTMLLLLGIVSAFAQPLAPEGLSVHAGLYGGAVLHWDSTSGAIGYRIYKSIDESPFGRIAEVERREFVDWYVFPGHTFTYYVTAGNGSGESDPSSTVTFKFDDHHPRPGQGAITGRITDENTGLPLKDAVVRFFTNAGTWTERTHTDSGGIYWAALDSGNYLVRAERFGYFGEWFDNAQRIENSSVVHLHHDTLTADFALQRIPPPTPVNVTGRVTDSLTGQGIPNAIVAFLRPHRILRELELETDLFGGFPSERLHIPELGDLHGVVWVGRTDTSGNYNAHVLGGLRYIAVAFKPGFIVKFYQDKYTPLEANRLVLNRDTSGIDFALVPNPLATNVLAGTVVDSTGAGVPSHVLLLRRTILGRFPVRFRMTDSLGNFEFNHLVNGNFYIKAIPVSRFAPAWYNATQCGVSNWRNADSIHVSSNVSGINVCVVPAPNAGVARIAGYIGRNAGGPVAHSANGGYPPAEGVTVYAVSNTTNQIMGYDITEGDGFYSIENIAPGTYQIVVDKEGFAPTTAPTYTVDATNNYEVSNSSIVLTPDAPTDVADNKSGIVTADFRLHQNYPNPFNPTTEIRFDIPKPSVVSLKIYNLIGQEVTVLTKSTLGIGSYSVRWNGLDANDHPVGSGIYFFKFAATPVEGTTSVYTSVRKMVLMK